jgi:phage shock protein A
MFVSLSLCRCVVVCLCCCVAANAEFLRGPPSSKTVLRWSCRRQEATVLGRQELAASSLDAQFEQLDATDDSVELDARLAALKAGTPTPSAIEQ